MRISSLIALFVIALLSSPAMAAPTVEFVGQVGYIDWENQRAIASGTGAPPAQAANAAQARAAARRAAVLDARRNLLEVVGQVRIDSVTRVENLLTQSDSITTRIQGVLQYSQILSESRQADGSYRVTVTVPLIGDLSREIFKNASPKAFTSAKPDPQLEQRLVRLEKQIHILTNAVNQLIAASGKATVPPIQSQELAALNQRVTALEESLKNIPEPAPEAKAHAAPAIPKEHLARVKQTTGLVLDARNTGFKPSLKPRVLTSSGEVLYPSENADYDRGVSQGFVRYFKDVAEASRSDRAGKAPMMLKAQAEGGDLVVSEADANLLKAALAQGGNFLDRLNVTVVF